MNSTEILCKRCLAAPGELCDWTESGIQWGAYTPSHSIRQRAVQILALTPKAKIIPAEVIL